MTDPEPVPLLPPSPMPEHLAAASFIAVPPVGAPPGGILTVPSANMPSGLIIPIGVMTETQRPPAIVPPPVTPPAQVP